MSQIVLNSDSAWLSFSGTTVVLLGTTIYSYKILAFLLYLSGFILLVLSIALFREEKEFQSSQVAIIIKQKQVRDEQPQTDEATILASIAAILILIGSCFIVGKPSLGMTNDRAREPSTLSEWIGLTLYIMGWVALGFTASMHNNAATSVQTDRLQWTLSGSFLVVIGSLIFVLSNFDIGLVIAMVGYICFTIGNVQVL
jgi:hypothetical protein